MGVRASSPASLGGIEFDAVKTKDEQLSAEVPEYATENGYTTSDDIIVKATTLNVTAIIANRPVTWYSRHGSSANRVAEVTRQLRKLFVSRELVTYIANGDTWENMALSSLKIPDDAESGDSVTVEFSLTQVTVTEKKTALVVVSFPVAPRKPTRVACPPKRPRARPQVPSPVRLAEVAARVVR